MFEKASKLKLRFAASVGYVNVEDLWDLPLIGTPSLNMIAKSVSRKLKAADEEDFVNTKAEGSSIDELRLEILKHVIAVKKANIDRAEKAATTKAKKQRILKLIDEKADDTLKGKSEEELRELLNDL